MYNLNKADAFRNPGSDPAYVLEITPVAGGLAAISSDQKLSLFNTQRLGQGPIKTIRTPHESIKCARAFDASNSIVCTAGSNGTVALWDLRLDGSRAQIAAPTGSDAPIVSLACSSSSNSIAAGTEYTNHQASILIWDARGGSAPRIRYNEVHSDDVTEVSRAPLPHPRPASKPDHPHSLPHSRIAELPSNHATSAPLGLDRRARQRVRHHHHGRGRRRRAGLQPRLRARRRLPQRHRGLRRQPRRAVRPVRRGREPRGRRRHLGRRRHPRRARVPVRRQRGTEAGRYGRRHRGGHARSTTLPADTYGQVAGLGLQLRDQRRAARRSRVGAGPELLLLRPGAGGVYGGRGWPDHSVET